MRKHSLAALAVLAVLIAGCGSSTQATAESITEEDPVQSDLIAGMGDWEWGTDLETIADSIYTDYEKEDEHLFEKASEERDGVLFIQTWDKPLSVGGYDSSAEFALADDKLCGGTYWIDEATEEDLPDLISKYTSVYGEPFLQKETTGWGQLTLWTDNDGDVIFISGYCTVYYLQSGSPFTSECEETLSKYHDVNLQKELGKIENTDGI